MLKVRVLNALSDIQVWPNRQAAEVHRRLQDAMQARLKLQFGERANGNDARLLLAIIQDKFCGVGLGTQMVSWAEDIVKSLGCENLSFVGTAADVTFMRQSGISAFELGGAGIKDNNMSA